jgi:hypothetical protein
VAGWSTEGVALGFERGTPMVADAARAMSDSALRAAMTDPWPASFPTSVGSATVGGALGLPSGQPIVIQYSPTFQVTVQGGGDPQAIASALDAQQRQIIREEITAFLLARSGG